jgi:hypothetical protein
MKRTEVPDGRTTETGFETRPWCVLIHWDDETQVQGPYECETWAAHFAREISEEHGIPTTVAPLFTPINRIIEMTRYNESVSPDAARDLMQTTAESQAAIRTGAGILNITVWTGDFGWCEDGDYEEWEEDA